MHWSQQHIEFLRKIVPELSGTPIYILRTDEHPVDWQPHWMAAFSPLGDLAAQSTLESLRLWSGRGVCVRVRNDFETWSPRMQRGTVLHELSHGLEFLSQPDALCPMADLSPVAREILTVGESTVLAESGIARDNLIRSQHGANFVRLCCHLHWRARTEVLLSPADLQILHQGYSLPESKYAAVVDSLSSELAMSRNLDLTRLREPPEAFRRLFA